MNNIIISKSSFIRGLQCHKSLWLHLQQPEERDEISESMQQIFDIGHSVGNLAQQLFPSGIDASRGDHSKIFEAVAYTSELINQNYPVIYEAAFSDGEVLCYMDILVKEPDGWAAYEVKASTQVKDYHINDAAFQYFTIRRSGLDLKRISLVHVNNQNVRRGKLDIHQLFTIEPMTEIVLPMQNNIFSNLISMKEMLAKEQMPEIEMNRQCRHPFDCDFYGFCIQLLPSTGSGSEILVPEPVEGTVRNQDALDEFLDDLEYPLYYMDFETIQFAVPMYNESRPYQQIPFQFSVHVQMEKDGPLEHFEFLASTSSATSDSTSSATSDSTISATELPVTEFTEGTGSPIDPRPDFIKSLLPILGDKGSIIVWNQTFENCRLKEIARDFPEYSETIYKLFPRVADLMVPFRQKHLYTPEMNGSYSIKYVLPALVPDLSYSDLEIQEGGTASSTYESLYHDTDSASVAKKREDLLRYCEMDTLAMVRIMERMKYENQYKLRNRKYEKI